MNVYIIGSLTMLDTINIIANLLNSKELNVRYVKKETKDFKQCVSDCYDNIEQADIIYAVKKKDGTIGNDVTYELEYAKRLKKQIVLIDTKDGIHL